MTYLVYGSCVVLRADSMDVSIRLSLGGVLSTLRARSYAHGTIMGCRKKVIRFAWAQNGRICLNHATDFPILSVNSRASGNNHDRGRTDSVAE